MIRFRFSEKPLAQQMIIFGAIIFVSTIVFTLIAQLSSLFMFPDLMEKSLQGLKDGNLDTIYYYKVMQLITSVAIFIVPPILFAHFYDRKIFDFFGFRKSLQSNLFLATLILMPVAIPLINCTQILNDSLHLPSFLSDLEKSMRLQNEEYSIFQTAFLSDKTFSGLTLNLFMMAVIPAIGEEMLFRGLLQRFLSKYFKNFHIPIFITSFIFSAIHFQIFSFLPRFLLGMAFGYMFYWSGNLVFPMIAHFVNNAMAVIVTFLVNTKHMASDPTLTPDNTINWTQTLMSLVLILLILKIFQKNGRGKMVNG